MRQWKSTVNSCAALPALTMVSLATGITAPAMAQNSGAWDQLRLPDEFIVTGLRIKRAGFGTTLPAIDVDEKLLEQRATTNVTDILKRKFTGFEGSLQSGISSRGDAPKYNAKAVTSGEGTER
jgi:hypothetical protein